ncbi:MAG: PAS domain-containing protein [Alphaproteobacteria bacterium]|nr:PAS domain-containing protein [Alphaproteobacteria bacterium]
MDLRTRDEVEPAVMSVPSDAHADIITLYEYWLSISPNGKLPSRDDFDPIDVPHLLPNLWLLEVHHDPLRFWRRTVGSRIEEFAGRNLTGGYVGEHLNNQKQSGVHSFLIDVLESKRPSWRRGKPLISFEKEFSELERLYLPLAADGDTVDMILAMTVFKTLPLPSAINLNKVSSELDTSTSIV